MSKHTPGPWMRAHVDPLIIIDGTHETIAVVSGDDSQWDITAAEAEANASLIAAAPEMLDMLKTIENDSDLLPTWLWLKIQRVIKKAEGKT